MPRVLLYERSHHALDSVRNVIGNFEDVQVVTADSMESVLEASEEASYEMVFIDVMEAGEAFVENISKIHRLNAESLLVAVGSVENSDNRELQKEMLKCCVTDYLNYQISADLMRIRFENYLDVIGMRKKRLFNHNAVNLFEKNTYHRTLLFRFDSETSLVQFWDYFIQETHYSHIKMESAIHTLYGLGSWLYRNHFESTLYLEESEHAIYLTLMPVDTISEKVIDDIVGRHASSLNYLHEGDRLTIKLDIGEPEAVPAPVAVETAAEVVRAEEKADTEVVEVSDETKKILSKTHFNKIPASEFVETTAISLMEKIDRLEEVESLIDEMLIGFEEEPGLEKLARAADAFLDYAGVVELMVEFDHLVFAIRTLAASIMNITEDQFDPKNIKKFVTLCLHLVYDLSTWRDNIFVKQEANDIHYLDSSLLSSCLQIEAVFAKKEIEEEEDDFELF